MTLEDNLASRMLAMYPAEAAAEFERLPDEATLAVLAGSPPAAAAGVLSRLAPLRAAGLLSRFEGTLSQEVADQLGVDRAAELARRMTTEQRTHFLSQLEPQTSQVVEDLVDYPEGTAGAYMDSRVLALPLDVTAREAIEQVRQEPENIRYNLYVVDRDRRLVGVLNLRELMLADRAATLGSIARRDVLSIRGHADKNAILAHRAWREAHSLPVVDREGVYLGAIRYRTWRRLEEEAILALAKRDSPTAEALGDLFSTGVEGLLGALTNIVSRPIAGEFHAED